MLTAEQGIAASRALSSPLNCLALPELDHWYNFSSSPQQSIMCNVARSEEGRSVLLLE